MEKRKISIDKAKELVKSTNGRVFGVTFIKKDGSVRVMGARLGVKKGVKGVGRNFKPSDYNLEGVYDMNNGFRMINYKTLKSLRFKGIEHEIEGV